MSIYPAFKTAYMPNGKQSLNEQGLDYWGQDKSDGFESCDRPINLELYSNRLFFWPCDHEIWRMTSNNNRALFLYYIKLCASFQIHWWIQTGFTVQKRSIWVEIGDMISCVTLKFSGWPWKTIGLLFYAISSFVQHFHSLWWIQSGVRVRKRPIWVKFDDF